MKKPVFGNLEKSFLILVSFIPLINGMSFVYMGSKESNFKWILEGLIYELPWILLILFVYNDDMGTIIAELGVLALVIGIIRTIYVSFTYKKEIIPGSGHMRKSSSSIWVIFSLLLSIYLTSVTDISAAIFSRTLKIILESLWRAASSVDAFSMRRPKSINDAAAATTIVEAAMATRSSTKVKPEHDFLMMPPPRPQPERWILRRIYIQMLHHRFGRNQFPVLRCPLYIALLQS